MNLYLIDKPECHHMTELMPGIRSVYQLQAEFEPYLKVHFVPNKDPAYKRKPGIIFQAGDDIIKRDFTFDDPNDIVEMRKIIWEYVNKMHKLGDATKGELPTFKVTQGWANKRRQIEAEKSKMCVIDCDKPRQSRDPDAYKVLHEVFKLQNTGVRNREECKRAHCQECTDNYPPESDEYKRCMEEVNYLCNGAFPVNKRVDKVISEREKIKKYLLDYLEKTDFRADKRHMDMIHESGLFSDIANRAGNKYTSFCSKPHAITPDMSEKDMYRKILTEEYNNSDNSKDSDNNQLIVLLLIGSLILFFYTKNK